MALLFVGQFHDPDDGDRAFFLKHKPTSKQYFYSPIAHTRYHPRKLTLKEEMEEKAFREFHSDMKDKHWTFLPILLLTISLTFCIVGLSSILFKKSLNYIHLMKQFTVNLLILPFGLIYIVWADTYSTSILTTFVIVTLNILAVLFLDKIKLNSNLT